MAVSSTEGSFDLGATRVPTGILAAAVVMLAVGGVLWWVARGLRERVLEVSNPWAIPVEGECWVDSSGDFVYAATARGDVYCAAVPTGAIKWRQSFPGLIPAFTRSVGTDLFLFREGGHLSCLQGPRGEEHWSVELGSEVLDPGLTSDDSIILVDRLGEEIRVRALSRRAGRQRWVRRVETGRPASLTLTRSTLLFVAGATLFSLDAVTGRENWSFDHAEDFLTRGPLAVTSDGAVHLSTPSRVLTVTPPGIVGGESGSFDPVRPWMHPIPIEKGRLILILRDGHGVLLSSSLEEEGRRRLSFEPSRVTVFGPTVLLSDASSRLGLLDLTAGELRVVGESRASGIVADLTLAGVNPVIGSNTGFELVPPNSFR